MNVFALGGYGKTALPAVKLLAQSEVISKIAIAGRNLEKAETTAAEIGEKAIATRADGTDEHMLASLLTDYDIVMNVAYNDTVLPTIRACTQTSTHYCDVSWGDVVEPALQLIPNAKAAGITAIIATGISPCISNLMGVYVARQLDEIEQLQIGRADIFNFQSGRELTPEQWLKNPKESLAVLPEFRQFIAMTLRRLQKNGMRTIRVYHKDQWVEVDPIRSGVEVPLPNSGTVTAYPYVSAGDYWGVLPHDLASALPVEVVFSPFPPQTHELLRDQALRILEGHIDTDTAVDFFYNTIENDPHHWLTLPDDFVRIPKMWVRAVGRKDGRTARSTCWFTSAMWNVGGYFLTSVALAAAVRKILRGETNQRGVMKAETAFDPLSFFDEVITLLPDHLPDGKMIGESFEWLE